jgi:MOSC domain-containing protein YiiM
LKLLQVCIGRAALRSINGQSVLTAIGKQAQPGRVEVRPLGLVGDEQADPTVHGGLSKAVYAYPSEHLPFWQTVRAQAGAAAWGEALSPGLLGENLLLQGLLETELWVGDRLFIGTDPEGPGPGCVLTVSEPRLPCFKFNAAMGFAQAAKLMQQSGFCGAYLAVRTPGSVQAGDAVRLEPGPREVALRELFRARVGPARGGA